LTGSIRVTMTNPVTVVKPVPRYGDFRFLQNGGRSPSWICYAYIWTIQEEYLVIFMAVQHLVGIGNAVLKICEFQCYASLA